MRKEFTVDAENESLFEKHNSKSIKLVNQKAKKTEDEEANSKIDVMSLVNKQPVWNEQIKSYTLDFTTRVLERSVKNFQLIHPAREDYIRMQFGRYIKETFTCDYTYPLCALQAFGIALSSLETKMVSNNSTLSSCEKFRLLKNSFNFKGVD